MAETRAEHRGALGTIRTMVPAEDRDPGDRAALDPTTTVIGVIRGPVRAGSDPAAVVTDQ